MSRLNSYVSLTLLATGLLAASCAQKLSVSYTPADESIPIERENLRMPSDSSHIIYTALNYPKIVYRFYQDRVFKTAWYNDSSQIMADSLFYFLRSVRFYGLLPQNYHMAELENLLYAKSPDSIYRKEVLFTDAFLSLANDLKYGRLFVALDSNKDSLILQVLENAFKHRQVKEILEDQEPVHKQYSDLKKSLGEILRSADSVDFAFLFSGMTMDSIEIHKNVQRIEINMERWRSENMKIEERCVWINIPSFQLYLMENGQAVMNSRIIVGKPESPTPVLSSLIECITLNPYWYVPRKIAVEEYLPEIQRDTSFITRNNFDVLDRKGNILNHDTLNWQRYTTKYFPVSLRQREGPENSLGVIKFVFDNPYAVFLHDTNIKSLFRKNVRAFSHGCIRMEKALDLAKYLVPNAEKMDLKLRSKERYTINIPNPIPIYTRYFTCESIEGELNFYDDVYALDKPIIDYLYGTRGGT